MADIVATIRLADGETGYYDEKSDIYLNWKHPVKDILKGTDCSGLRTSARFGRIKVIAGSLGQDKSFKQVLMEAKSKRTGIPLKKLMGKSPIVTNTEPQEIINKPVKSDDTPVSEIPVDKPAASPKRTSAKKAAAAATGTDTTTNTKETTSTSAKTNAKTVEAKAVDSKPVDEKPAKTNTDKSTTNEKASTTSNKSK